MYQPIQSQADTFSAPTSQ